MLAGCGTTAGEQPLDASQEVPVSDDVFWATIGSAASAADPEAALSVELSGWSPDAIVEFDRRFRATLHQAYSWDVWGAGYLIEGGMSDDAFEYFRVWLIFQGRTTFDAVLEDPDRVATLQPGAFGYTLEGPQYVAAETYKSRTGDDMPMTVTPPPDLGDGWDFDDPAEMSARYPMIWASLNE